MFGDEWLMCAIIQKILFGGSRTEGEVGFCFASSQNGVVSALVLEGEIIAFSLNSLTFNWKDTQLVERP